MTIFDEDGQMMEEVELYKLETREEMHKLMVDKGFLKKTKAQKVAEIQLARMEQRVGGGKPGSSSFTGTMGALYVMVTVVLAGKCLWKFTRMRDFGKCPSRIFGSTMLYLTTNPTYVLSFFPKRLYLCHIFEETKEKVQMCWPSLTTLGFWALKQIDSLSN